MRLDEAKKSHVSCVYCLLFPNGKCYVGKTKDLSKRVCLFEDFGNTNKELSSAIVEFGVDNIDIRVLRSVKCDDSVDLDVCLSILEVKYIRGLGSLYPNGYNISLGGECLGIPIECITTNSDSIRRFSNGSKVVLCYNLDGNFVKEYDSIGKCAYDNGVDEDVIRRSLGKNKVFADKWYLRVKRYDYIPKHIELANVLVKDRIVYNDIIIDRVKYRDVIVRREVEKVVERKVIKKTHILKYDMNGDFCGEYDNLKEACLSFTNSPSGISCGMYRKGYILFKKRSDDYPTKIEPYHILNKKILGDYYVPINELEDKPIIEKPERRSGQKKVCHKEVGNNKKLRVDGKYTNIINNFPIVQCTFDGEIVRRFNSVRDASRETGICYANILACVNGTTKKSHGFIWKKAEE